MKSNYKSHVRRVTVIGLLLNLFLCLLKFGVGVMGKSQAVIADAVHSLSDMSTDIAIILGVHFWSAPPDEEHPYGHSRIETLVTIGIGCALVAVALGLSYSALDCVRDVEIPQPGWIALAGPAVSLVSKEILYRWTLEYGTRLRSPSLVANAWHHRSDALSSLPALIAVAAAAIHPEWAFVDRVGALVVSLLILKVAWDIMRPAFDEILERGAAYHEIVHIERIVKNVADVKDVHAIRTRKLGTNYYVDLHILLSPDMTVRAGHHVAEAVKSELIENGPNVIDVVVHMEPIE